jgi:hypothetical protein
VTAIAVAPDSKSSVETRSAAAGEVVTVTSTEEDSPCPAEPVRGGPVESLRCSGERSAEEALDLLKEAFDQRAAVSVFELAVGFEQFALLHGEPRRHLDYDPDHEVAAAMAT